MLTYANVTRLTVVPADRFQAPAFRGIVVEDRTQSIIDSIDRAPRLAVQKPKSEKAREPETQDIPPIEIDVPGMPGRPTLASSVPEKGDRNLYAK